MFNPPSSSLFSNAFAVAINFSISSTSFVFSPTGSAAVSTVTDIGTAGGAITGEAGTRGGRTGKSTGLASGVFGSASSSSASSFSSILTICSTPCSSIDVGVAVSDGEAILPRTDDKSSPASEDSVVVVVTIVDVVTFAVTFVIPVLSDPESPSSFNF